MTRKKKCNSESNSFVAAACVATAILPFARFLWTLFRFLQNVPDLLIPRLLGRNPMQTSGNEKYHSRLVFSFCSRL